MDPSMRDYTALVPRDEAPLLEIYHLALQVKQFINSNPVGRYLVDRAETERQTALRKLVECGSDDVEAMRAAKLKVDVANAVLSWLDEALRQGQDAVEEFLQDELAEVADNAENR